MKVVLASSNQNKCKELGAALPGRYQLVTQGELGIAAAEETGATFVENALLKARHAAAASGLPALADDSGLVVSGLGGRPGIYSARFSGPGATDASNNAKLLSELQGVAERAAYFYCCLVFMRGAADPTPLVAEGIWPGSILPSARGEGGFGYDPLFQPAGMDCAVAELPASVKLQHSHRGRALRQLAEKLDAL